MIRLRCDFFAETLELSTSMTVLLPQLADGQIGMASTIRESTPVLYLLHGLSDDDTTWGRRTSIERYAAELGIAVVMPQVHRSFYTNQQDGCRYWDFLSQELPELVASQFRVSDRREDTFVAGLSMGGYGALKLGLNYPERFAAVAAFSAVIKLDWLQQFVPELYRSIWGSDPLPARDDLAQLLSALNPAQAPKFWISCGAQDRLVADNRDFVVDAKQAGLEVHDEFPPGDHEWSLWDSQVQRFLSWIK